MDWLTISSIVVCILGLGTALLYFLTAFGVIKHPFRNSDSTQILSTSSTTTQADYQLFVEKMTKHMGSTLGNQLRQSGQESVDELLQSLYPLYLSKSDDLNYKQFANTFKSIAVQLLNDNPDYSNQLQEDINNAVLDYMQTNDF